jgi:Uncharacterized membrane protein
MLLSPAVLIFFAAVVGVPLCGIALFMSGLRGARNVERRKFFAILKLVAGAAICSLFLYVAGFCLHQSRQTKILAQGFSPEGREYCVAQTFNNIIEPFQVSFYMRDSEGIWRWSYLAHQDYSWSRVRVDFQNGKADVFKRGKFMRSIDAYVPLPADHPPRDSATYDLSADLGVDDVFKAHNSKFGN